MNLKAKPFNLNEEQISNVNRIISTMTIEEKIGQLFFLLVFDDNPDYLQKVSQLNPGGVMLRPMTKAKVKKAHRILQTNAKIPLFLSANLEYGSDGICSEGIILGANMLLAATGNPQLAYRQAKESMNEARKLGSNMTFSPVVDINYNFLNPITNTRSFGDNPRTVLEYSKKFISGIQENGGFSIMKHFPGDGVDGRDHHIIKTTNNLSFEKWFKTYGEIYQKNIDAGVAGIMSGHISLPSYFKENDPEKDYPASLSKQLLTDLLRTKLGFNGLIITDATLMAGFSSVMSRKLAVPHAIAAGNDMFLFTKNFEEDYQFMLEGYQTGIITEKRLNEALQRIIGLKQTINSNENTELNDENLANTIADQGITLVKDSDKVIPLKIGSKIGLINLASEQTFNQFNRKLSKYVETEIMDLSQGNSNPQIMMKNLFTPMEEFKAKYDVILYIIEQKPTSNRISNRIEYQGLEYPWFNSDVRTGIISFGSPYMGYDIQASLEINSYHSSEVIIEQTIQKICGQSKFKGSSPVKLDYEYFKEGNL